MADGLPEDYPNSPLSATDTLPAAKRLASRMARLRPLHPTAMNPPSPFLQLLSLLLRHLQLIGRPVFRPPLIPGRAHRFTTRSSGEIFTSRMIYQTVALLRKNQPTEAMSARCPSLKTPLLSFPQYLLKTPVLGLGLVRKSQGMRSFPSVQSKRAIPLTDACQSSEHPMSYQKPLPHVHCLINKAKAILPEKKILVFH